MAREIDLSKPLDEATIAYLRQTRPREIVDRLIYVASQNASDGAVEGSADPADSDEENTSDDEAGDVEQGSEDPSEEGSFDPDEHNVDQVNEYLVTASPEEAERVLALEREGKSRSGILNN